MSFKGIHFKPRTLKFMGVRGDPTHNTLTLGRSLTDHRYQPLKEISERRMISRLHTLEPEAYRIGENGALEKVEGPGDSDKEKEEKQEITPELTVTYETVSKKNLQQIWEELKQKNERGELEEKLMKRLEEALQPAPTMEDTEYTGEGLEEVVLLEPDDDDDDDDEEE